MHYVDWGNPDAPPLLLIHGGRDHCRNWDWVAQALRHDWHIIAPDLRGHGDSAWSSEGDYSIMSFVYDLAQLIHQLELEPVNLVAHSLGGSIAAHYTGLHPEGVTKLVVIEGLGAAPPLQAEFDAVATSERLRQWIDNKRAAAGRTPKRYANLDEALARMQSENSHLSDEQARHLTIHGTNQNEDGSYSWKFDKYVRIEPPVRLPREDVHDLWRAITCPTLLLYGADSWASNPAEDGRANYFNNARVELYENAGHWLHHDRTDKFVADVRAFLNE